MAIEENKDSGLEPAATVSPTTPAPKATGLAKSTKVMIGITGTAVVVAALVVVLALGKNSNNQTKSDQVSGSSQSTSNNSPGATATSPQSAKPIQTVNVDEALDLQLRSVKSQKNTLAINFSYVSTGYYDGINYNNPLYPDKLKDAYIVDDTTNQKYEVITDANDKPLVSDLDQQERIGLGTKGTVAASFYVTVKAPPAGSTINIFIPGGSQAFTGIKLNN